MKNEYFEAEVEIIKFTSIDVITSSPCTGDGCDGDGSDGACM